MIKQCTKILWAKGTRANRKNRASDLSSADLPGFILSDSSEDVRLPVHLRYTKSLIDFDT
jgi:hypothetical protein